jgi:multicomponent Na+:H+ antiporter subunit B
MKGDHHVILRVVAKVLIPIIALYGFYVHFHGEYSPGGGFQAGVILAVTVVLYSLIFGIAPAMRAITPGFARFIAGLGFIIYVGVGIWALAMGGNFLDYDALFREPPGGHNGQHVGIIVIEIGVLFAVAGSMVSIFYAFAGRVSEIRDEDW